MENLPILKGLANFLGDPAPRNLRRYIYLAILPPMPHAPTAPSMPPDGHKSHLNKLSIIPQNYRKLQTMHLVRDLRFLDEVTAFLDRYIPATILDVPNENPVTGEHISIPCYPHFTIANKFLGQVASIDRVCRWVCEYPLETAQRIMHLLFPESDDWTFDEAMKTDQLDGKLIRHRLWGPAETVSDPTTGALRPRVTVIVQPPWILSPKDFELFVQCTSLPPLQVNRRLEVQTYGSKERLWGKVWDICFREKSHWFVITTYWGWAFGAFSEGWTQAYITDVHTSDSAEPTIIEFLIYWFSSALGISDSWKRPEVPEPVDAIGLEIARSTPPPSPHRIYVASSTSSFNIRVDELDMMSEAGTEEVEEVERMLDDTGGEHSVASLLFVNPLMRQPPEFVHARVQQWQAAADFDYWGNVRPSSPTHSVVSTISSVSTVKDLNDRAGAWLARQPMLPPIRE